ncbi:MAG: signal recognition particle protein [Erysipelotrichaceae bacterium]|nr:signal recognition particle protein [Erysipelotrichaceae bacterium]
MAFDTLQEKLTKTIRNLQGKGKLTEKNMEETLKDIRVALLEADVNYGVTRDFLNSIREKALGQEVLTAVEPSQQLVKIVHDELMVLLGDETPLHYAETDPSVFVMVGLQGTGKTTQAAKIANYLKYKQHKKVLLIAADVVRPAAIEQLQTLGSEINVEVFSLGTETGAVETVRQGLAYAEGKRFNVIIIDTAGRLQIDEELMQELRDIKEVAHPSEILLTVDALTGQDIVNVAKTFHEQLDVTGLIVTKFDGDAKGGGVLSVKAVTGVPIKFTGTGERIEDLEVFHPDRLADRILGMGDIVTLVEQAQEKMDMEKAERDAQRMLSGKFTMDDLLSQIEQSQKMGPLASLAKMIPGMSDYAGALEEGDADKQLVRTKAMIQSMTKEEREDPSIINSNRKRRIAAGSGTTTKDVGQLLNQYERMKKMMKQLQSLKGMFGINF